MRRPAKLSAALLTAGMLLLSAVSAAQSAESPSSRAPEADPYGRLTPKQAIIGFLRATDEGDFERAAEYLDLRNLPDEITEYTPDQLALGFAIVLQRSLWLDIDSLSDDPAGAADDGLPSYRELIGTIPTSDGPTPRPRRSPPTSRQTAWSRCP